MIGALIARLGRRIAAHPPTALETRQELSDRYLAELRELVDDDLLTIAQAEEVLVDLFDAGPPGTLPLIKSWVWQSHAKERTGYVVPQLVSEAANIKTSLPEAD